MVDVLGYDVGGANTKAAFVSVKGGKLLNDRPHGHHRPGHFRRPVQGK